MRPVLGLKEFVFDLENQGEIRRITVPVDPQFEIAAILTEMDDNKGPALLFENVRGYGIPLVGNLLGTKSRMAMALGLSDQQLAGGLLPNQGQTIPPVPLLEPCERVVRIPDKASGIMDLLPILTHYAKDSGPYITAGVGSAKDPRNGGVGRGLHRLEVRSRDELGITLINPPLSDIYAYHKANGSRMEMAIAIGVDPAILISTVLKMPGIDKLSGAGGLVGAAISTEKAQSVDVEFPAHAEIIIEGYIDPQEKMCSGNLGEVSGYYVPFDSPSIHVTAISHRKDPLFQAVVPKSLEVDHLLSFVHGLNFIPKVKNTIPAIDQVHFVPGTFGAHVAMSINSENRGEIRNALVYALSFPNIKKAVVVDTDVNPGNLMEIEWAMATRCQADKDLIVIPCLKGQAIDPSSGEGFTSAKLGIDATRPQRNGYEMIGFPEEIQGRLTSLINNLRQED